MAEGWQDTQAPSGEVGRVGGGLQASQGDGHGGVAVLGQCRARRDRRFGAAGGASDQGQPGRQRGGVDSDADGLDEFADAGLCVAGNRGRGELADRSRSALGAPRVAVRGIGAEVVHIS